VDGNAVGSQLNEEFYYQQGVLGCKARNSFLYKVLGEERAWGGDPSSKDCSVQIGKLRIDLKLKFFLLTPFSLRKFLTPPPTSTDVECLFSVAGLIAADNRSRLSPETLEEMFFLRETGVNISQNSRRLPSGRVSLFWCLWE
jgi:hypothetical protein